MLRVLILSCSLKEQSKSRILAHAANDFLHKQGIETRLVDMREVSLPEYGSEECDQSVAVQQLTQEIAWANGVVIATPIYNWAVNSVVKKVVEATGADETGRKVRAWEDKVITFLCSAGVPQAYLAYLPTANSLMVDYKCIINPHVVFAVESDFDGSKITNESISKRLERVVSIAVELIDALKDRKLLSGWVYNRVV